MALSACGKYSTDKKYYQILDLSPMASLLDIKTNYRKLAIKMHPDKNLELQCKDKDKHKHDKDHCQQCIIFAKFYREFQLIQEAYEILTNPDSKKTYDAFIKLYPEGAANQSMPQGQYKSQSHYNGTGYSKQYPYSQNNQYQKSKEKTEQTKKDEAAQRLMDNLGLTYDAQKELWRIYRDFLSDKEHFKNRFYSPTVLRNMVYVFSDIGLINLDKESRNNSSIVDASFNHSWEGLKLASKSVIDDLLDYKESKLRTTLQDYAYCRKHKIADFFNWYTYEVDVNIFARLMVINPLLVRSLKPEDILAFLRHPQCRQYKGDINFSQLYVLINLYEETNIPNLPVYPVDDDLAILLEIYRFYDRKILRRLEELISGVGKYNKNFIKKLFAKYSNLIDLQDILYLNEVVELDSLNFVYNSEDDTLLCAGKINLENNVPLMFSNILKVGDSDDSSQSNIMIKLAQILNIEVFHRLIASIPLNKRAQYLFSTAGTQTAYTAYRDRINKTHAYDWFQKQAYHNALAELIYPTAQITKDEGVFTTVKQAVLGFLENYTAWWKLSMFGHHHDSRARCLIADISKAGSLAEIALMIDNQIAIMEHKTKIPLFKEQTGTFVLDKLFSGNPYDYNPELMRRWYNSCPRNLPPQNNLGASGYYRALRLAQEVIKAPENGVFPAYFYPTS